MKEYGVTEDSLFHEDDLLYRTNIAKVSRCLREVLILVSRELTQCSVQTRASKSSIQRFVITENLLVESGCYRFHI